MAGVQVAITKYNNWLKDNEYSLTEEAEIYDEILQDVFHNPRWYLDNLESLSTFRVSWHRYYRVKQNYAVIPYKFTLNGKAL